MQQPDMFLDEGMRGFIVNTAKREFWRVAELCDFDDLVQDGYMCYAKCRRAYLDGRTDLTGTKDERRWFQALVKTAFNNHIHTLSAKRKFGHTDVISQLGGETQSTEAVWDSLLEAQPEDATLLTVLASAPAEIVQLVKLLAGDGLNALGFERKRKGRRALRETTNEYYCRLLGKDPTVYDVVGQLKAYFGK